MLCAASLAAGGLLSAPAATAAANSVPVVTGDARVDALLARMTLAQKLTLLEGQAEVAGASDQYQAGYLPGIPSLGIPSLTLSDGPPGVITRQDSTGMTGTMGLAATFSQPDARANGVVIGRDARALGMDVVLEPFVNLDRDTAWARGFDTFGEDPLLTGQTGADEIEGIQSQGEMAMAKHYLGYDGGSNVIIGQQALHEIYLQPFADAVQAGVSSVMCSYNGINGAPACGNSGTLTQVLRGELGFKGFVASDWGANYATSFLNDGLDLEMPGSGGPPGAAVPAYFTPYALKADIAGGVIKESAVTRAVGRILYEYDRFGLLSGVDRHTVTPEPATADEQVVQQTGEDAATLLKNDDSALPLSRAALSSLALIGPGAGQAIATDGGGEKAGGIVAQQAGPYQVLKSELGSPAHLTYAAADDLTGTPVPASALSHGGAPGLLRTTAGVKAGKAVTVTQADRQLDFTSGDGNALAAGSGATWTGTLTVPAAGEYWLNIQSLGATARLAVDGKALTTVGGYIGAAPRYGVVHATDGNGPLPTTDGLANGRTEVKLAAGPHTLAVTATPDASGAPVQARLDWVTPAQQQANTAAAVAAARGAHTAVVFAWADGGDDLSQPLPEGQDQLIEEVAKVNPNTIVVLNTGEPVALPWLSKVKAVLEMWYPGDRGGYATASVLLGRTDPGGKLPVTWPAAIWQEVAHQPALHPARTSAGVDGAGQPCPLPASNPVAGLICTTSYSEGIDVGYRFFDATGETPLFPFGSGLSYTTFGYSSLRATRARDGSLDVSYRVTNTGRVAGDDVSQVYLGPPGRRPAGVQFADRALAGYNRTTLGPGQSKTVSVAVPQRQLQYWSDAGSRWQTATGNRMLYVGGSERSLPLSVKITVDGTSSRVSALNAAGAAASRLAG